MLAVRVVGTVFGKLACYTAVDSWSQHGCARSHSKAVDVIDGVLREHLSLE